MRWRIGGRLVHACSCKLLCPCYFGPAEPDEGWCSGAFVFDIERGDSDGIALEGTRVAWLIDLPRDFFGGNGTARLYINRQATSEQRRELDAIFTGARGGIFELSAAMVTRWLPPRFEEIAVEWRDEPSVTVGAVGRVRLVWVKTEDGRKTRLVDAPALARFKLGSSELAHCVDSAWSDPDMRAWKSGGSGSVTPFEWSD